MPGAISIFVLAAYVSRKTGMMSKQPVEERPAAQPRKVVRLKPPDYQPTPEELEELITVPEGTTEDDLLKALVTPVTVVYDD